MNEITAAPLELEDIADAETVAGDPLIKRNLSLLGHVQVRLDVHLGSAEVDVQRLFALGKGDSLTLDTALDAPMTLQLDGKPIARGHLLAVGDAFGFKIVEIL